MPDTKISALTAASSLADTDELVIASAGASKKITGANLKAAIPGSMALLSTTTLSVAGTFDVSGISQAYNDLVLVLIARSNQVAISDNAYLRFNNDSAANYAWQNYQASGGTGSPFQIEGNSTTFIELGGVPAANAAASWFSMHEIAINGYASTTWMKITRAKSNFARSITTGDRNMRDYEGVWANTAAINRIQVNLGSGLYLTGSQLRIYGRL